jgi:hypothetical protein
MFRCVKTAEGLRIDLGANEVNLFLFLGRELRRLLEKGDPDQAMLKPFHPGKQRADDPHAVRAEMDAGMDADLMQYRLARIETIQKELLPAETKGKRLRLVLDETRTDLWLAYLADMRLLVGTVIGFSVEDPMPYPEDDPDQWTQEIHMYHFLSYVQEEILEMVMGEE